MAQRGRLAAPSVERGGEAVPRPSPIFTSMYDRLIFMSVHNCTLLDEIGIESLLESEDALLRSGKEMGIENCEK